MKALILTWTGFQDQEVIYPYYRLQGAGFNVQIAADQRDSKGRFYGIFGCNMPCHATLYEDNSAHFFGDVDLLILPGGVKALEKLRQSDLAVWFVAHHHALGKIIASTCHGAQMLISAGLAKGRIIAAYPSIKDDINNAGGVWSGDPVVVDDRIVSSPHYDHMGIWMETALAEVARLEAAKSVVASYQAAP